MYYTSGLNEAMKTLTAAHSRSVHLTGINRKTQPQATKEPTNQLLLSRPREMVGTLTRALQPSDVQKAEVSLFAIRLFSESEVFQAMRPETKKSSICSSVRRPVSGTMKNRMIKATTSVPK